MAYTPRLPGFTSRVLQAGRGLFGLAGSCAAPAAASARRYMDIFMFERGEVSVWWLYAMLVIL